MQGEDYDTQAVPVEHHALDGSQGFLEMMKRFALLNRSIGESIDKMNRQIIVKIVFSSNWGGGGGGVIMYVHKYVGWFKLKINR